jgi:hypothetical protein
VNGNRIGGFGEQDKKIMNPRPATLDPNKAGDIAGLCRRVDPDRASEGLLRNAEARDVIARLLGRHAGRWHQVHSSGVMMTAPAAPNRSINSTVCMLAIELIVKP